MNLDWNTIVLSILTVLFSWETFNNIRYRRENKKLKQNEVKTSDANTQTEQINLGELFMQKSAEMFQRMQELQEQTLKATQKNGLDNESIIKQINALAEEQKKIIEEQKRFAEEQVRQGEELTRLADEQSHIVQFVNGEYQEFLVKNGFKKKQE